jgi:indole-3-glycerol phosphate synthase/phosphoribosylanthranilate isomerase
MMIAGGIGPDNCAQAMALGVAGLDMNSALEESPGVKSPERIRRAFGRLREYRE